MNTIVQYLVAVSLNIISICLPHQEQNDKVSNRCDIKQRIELEIVKDTLCTPATEYLLTSN